MVTANPPDSAPHDAVELARVALTAEGTDAGSLREVHVTLAQAVLAMHERIGALCGYPLCDCKGSECMVLNGPIPEKGWRDELRAEYESQVNVLRTVLEAIVAVDDNVKFSSFSPPYVKATADMRKIADAALSANPPAAEGWKGVTKDSRGNTLFVEDNKVGGHTYWSDEIGGGVMVWDTSVVSSEMVRLALKAEEEDK